jgi:TetR/AcrR family transcriptional regulator, transcriptional repressor for nem operon
MALIESTKTKALKEGKSLLQLFGYNGFSFQHIADALGLRKQSLYVHFKSKEELGEDVLEDYQRGFKEWSETISSFGPEEKLGAWFDRFYKIACDDLKYCPLAALASDYNSLPKGMQKKLNQIYDLRLTWITDVIQEGQKKKIFRRDFKSENLARLAMTCGFGAQQISRLSNDSESVLNIKKDVMKILKAEA